nr:hypothetical protein Itr_chr15CG13030 [Ipomoea trifida]
MHGFRSAYMVSECIRSSHVASDHSCHCTEVLTESRTGSDPLLQEKAECKRKSWLLQPIRLRKPSFDPITGFTSGCDILNQVALDLLDKDSGLRSDCTGHD